MFPSLGSPQLPTLTESAGESTPIQSGQNPEEAGLRKAAQEFEAAYIAQMLTFSGLDKALMAGGGDEVAAFTSFYIESFAEQIAEKGGFGLAQNFYERMAKLSALTSEQSQSGFEALEDSGENKNVDLGKM